MILDDCLGVGALAGVEFLFCNAGGTVGMASTVLVVGPLGAAGGISESTGACWNSLRGCRIGILLACSWSWLEEVAVPSENGSTGSFYHVGVGFLAFLSNNCFFPLPGNRILEPYILSWF